MENKTRGLPLRILIVEDDEDDLLIIKDLIREGLVGLYPILDHVTTVAETLSSLEANEYHLCIFDYLLGEVDGLQLLRKIRARGKILPIIFLTGQGDQEVAVEAMKAGANDYLPKGQLTTESLAHSIRYAIELRKEAQARKETEDLLKKFYEELTQKNLELETSLQKLQAAQNQILRSEKLAGIGRLAAGVCHEILNPLNIISGHAQALLMERRGDNPLRDDLNSIMEEIARIEKIISGLLKFSRKGDMEFRFVDINKELESVLSLVEKEMLLGNIRIVRKYDFSVPHILIDSDRMRQVFLNIINNAKYAMHNGGLLTITTAQILMDRRRRKRGESAPVVQIEPGSDGIAFLRISFSDTGTGIKKENLGKLFDPFFTTKPEDKGTGLGLSVCYTIIEKHSGTLDVESEYGHGATFIIDLPFERSAEEQRAETETIGI